MEFMLPLIEPKRRYWRDQNIMFWIANKSEMAQYRVVSTIGCGMSRQRDVWGAAQSDLDELAKRAGKRRLLSWKRVGRLSPKQARRLGGAAAVFGRVCIGQDVAAAAAEIRRAVLAHELAHVQLGHCYGPAAAVALLPVYAGLTVAPGSAAAAAAVAVLATITGALLWSTRPARELEADAFAARLVGAAAVSAALRWSVGGAPHSALTKRRLSALDEV